MEVKMTAGEYQLMCHRQLVTVLQQMLNKEISYFEGSREVFRLRSEIDDVSNSDPDFNSFVVIYSETMHLPYQAQRNLWSPKALEKLDTEFIKIEEWADKFAPQSCLNLIKKYAPNEHN
jgi:Protein of unknown function (DUF2489)